MYKYTSTHTHTRTHLLQCVSPIMSHSPIMYITVYLPHFHVDSSHQDTSQSAWPRWSDSQWHPASSPQGSRLGLSHLNQWNMSWIMTGWLVVGPPLWKIWKSIGMIIPNIWENKKCSKPPTSYGSWLNYLSKDVSIFSSMASCACAPNLWFFNHLKQFHIHCFPFCKLDQQ